jgi:hypothetical protein
MENTIIEKMKKCTDSLMKCEMMYNRFMEEDGTSPQIRNIRVYYGKSYVLYNIEDGIIYAIAIGNNDGWTEV